MAQLGRKPAKQDLYIRTGDIWSFPLLFNDKGDHNRDGIIEDPNNPLPLNVSGYTFTAQLKNKANDSTAIKTFSFTMTDAATGKVIMNMSAADTTALLLPHENRLTRDYVYDLQAVLTATPTNIQTWLYGDVTVELDVTR